MMNASEHSPPSAGARWATVVVLFHPDPATIDFVLALSEWDYRPIAVVNAITPGLLARLRAASLAGLIVNEANIGLASALNQGIAAAMHDGAEYVLLLDQDSRPERGTGEALLQAAYSAQHRRLKLACVGPILVDRKAPDANLSPSAAQGELVPTGTIATSGALISAAAIGVIGPMWEALFIDGIDHEWCWRAHSAGWGVFIAPRARMLHDMGDHAIDLLGRYKPVHRSPFRHYHIVRNTLWLARLRHVPLRWRLSELAKLAYRMPAYAAFSSKRGATVAQLAKAVAAGVRRPPA